SVGLAGLDDLGLVLLEALLRLGVLRLPHLTPGLAAKVIDRVSGRGTTALTQRPLSAPDAGGMLRACQ
ncbi:hypothetical protein ABT119_40400, partial [Streptomyces sp. NPDC001910]|uniref:hypothetical protein n=1 Tax=Streptomyces sp. NPDC001910 TaxID=3154403 RepID=UPI00331DDB4E